MNDAPSKRLANFDHSSMRTANMNEERGTVGLRPGTPEYDAHLREEIEHYGAIFKSEPAKNALVQPVPPSWVEMERRAATLVRGSTGDDVYGHVAKRLGHDGARMLSLGSGACGVELDIGTRAPSAEIVCADINSELLQLGKKRAEERGLNLRPMPVDLNEIDLPRRAFDVVFCHASLHHVIEVDRLGAQIAQALTTDGALIITDVITRNGYLMWPETHAALQAIWRTLPPKFRMNHTAYSAPQLDDDIWQADTSNSGMECIASEEILPMLARYFACKNFVPYFSICRRVFDTMYGPNFNLADPLDKSILDWIWELDCFYLGTNRLRPETFFGIYLAS